MSEKAKSLSDADLARLAIEVVEKLHGLNVAQFRYVLSAATTLVELSSHVDATGKIHEAMLADYNRVFGGDKKGPMRQ